MATAEQPDREALEDLSYVGPRTAERLADADVTAGDLREKRVAYRDLVAAGVNPGVAAKIRREHSLHWTLDEQGADLDRRSELVRGLRDEERAWVAAARDGSDREAAREAADDPDGDWTVGAVRSRREAEDDGDDAFRAEEAWRRESSGNA